jgi:hypothetical protein
MSELLLCAIVALYTYWYLVLLGLLALIGLCTVILAGFIAWQWMYEEFDDDTPGPDGRLHGDYID